MNQQPAPSYKDKLARTGPRKLLACDGGGIRGIISVEILARIEKELRAASGKPGLVLADYFDYVAGTSTGAIIATLVSLGFSMDEAREFYLKSGAEMFQPARLWERLRTKFDDDNLTKMLKDIIGEATTLASERLRTLLMIVLRNATTDSPWPVSSNPRAKYNELAVRGDGSNLHLPLWQLVRASTAAPTYFPPEVINVGPHQFVFVDGGVTMYNNPAFHLFLMATTEPYRLCWPTGEDRMLVISVGTGASANANKNLSPREMNLIYNASNIPSALMAAALHEQDFLCRIFGKCLAGDPLDREVGDVIGQGLPLVPKLFTYARYNAELSREGLDAFGLSKIDPAHVQQMDSVEHVWEMQEVGRAAAARKVQAGHFAGFPA
jgi:patatin-like phospholipase/acyl hydrolase